MNRIQELRKREGLTQEQLAEKVLSSKTSISGYEGDDRDPGSDMLKTLADFFGVSIDYLLGVTDAPFRATLEDSFENEQEIELIAAYRKLNADAKTKLVEFLKTLN